MAATAATAPRLLPGPLPRRCCGREPTLPGPGWEDPGRAAAPVAEACALGSRRRLAVSATTVGASADLPQGRALQARRVLLAAVAATCCRRSRRRSRIALGSVAEAKVLQEPASVAGAAPASGARLGAALVKIFVAKQRPSMAVPWQANQVESSSGSGTLIRRRGPAAARGDARTSAEEGDPPYWHCVDVEEAIPDAAGDLVLTAAHVVSDARDVRVQRLSASGGTPDKFVARVIAVAHDCDLALLEVLEEECFQGVEPMGLFGPAELLDVQEKVQVMGFPVGGDYLSITEGVLSRVEVVEYSHSRRQCLALTVDAAINAGNSGGPVVDPRTGRMLAVAHQKVVAIGVENQGHAVPPCLIWRFLWGQARDRRCALPAIGAFLQHLESPAHRKQLKLEEGETGVLVREVYRLPGERPGQLHVGDVLLRVGPHAVDNFGAVRLLDQRVALSAVQDLLYMGDGVRLTVRREGKVLELLEELGPAKSLVPRSLYGEGNTSQTRFLVRGGLVFVPLTADFLEQAWPSPQDRPAHLMDLFYRGGVSPEKREALVLLSILADDTNAGHGAGYVGCPIVESVGGTRVVDLAHLAQLLDAAVREAEFVEIDVLMSIGPYSVVLRSEEVVEADERIQELYQLPRLASEVL